MCACWGLSRTYLPSLKRKLGAFPCPRLAVAPRMVIQARPYVIVNVKPAGGTADIRCTATGHMVTVNRCRLKFLEAIPQHALHLKHLPRALFH